MKFLNNVVISLVVAMFMCAERMGSAPLPCQSDNSISGYTDWLTLQNDIMSYSGIDEGGERYILCPGVTFAASQPIHIYSTITIQCGSDDAPDKTCTIMGGSSHFILELSASLTMKRITMRGADDSSILALGEFVGAEFDDCTWEENHSSIGGGAIDTFDSKRSLVFELCAFKNNEGYQGALATSSSDLILHQCLFQENRSTCSNGVWGSAVTQINGDSVFMSFQSTSPHVLSSTSIPGRGPSMLNHATMFQPIVRTMTLQ